MYFYAVFLLDSPLTFRTVIGGELPDFGEGIGMTGYRKKPLNERILGNDLAGGFVDERDGITGFNVIAPDGVPSIDVTVAIVIIIGAVHSSRDLEGNSRVYGILGGGLPQAVIGDSN